MSDIIADSALVAACGLYCGACGKYRKGRCPGCAENTKAGWCKIRKCTTEQEIQSCADCGIADYHDCSILNNWIAKLIELVSRSNRPACLDRISEAGYDNYARDLAEQAVMTLPKPK